MNQVEERSHVEREILTELSDVIESVRPTL